MAGIQTLPLWPPLQEAQIKSSELDSKRPVNVALCSYLHSRKPLKDCLPSSSNCLQCGESGKQVSMIEVAFKKLCQLCQEPGHKKSNYPAGEVVVKEFLDKPQAKKNPSVCPAPKASIAVEGWPRDSHITPSVFSQKRHLFCDSLLFRPALLYAAR